MSMSIFYGHYGHYGQSLVYQGINSVRSRVPGGVVTDTTDTIEGFCGFPDGAVAEVVEMGGGVISGLFNEP
jgi:hypothetical protein